MLTASQLYKSFGPQVVADGVSFSLQREERIGLVGANGSGKSTLARILAGLVQPDAGEVQVASGARVAYLDQSPTFADGVSAREAVLSGLGEWSRSLGRYHEVTEHLAAQGNGEAPGSVATQAKVAEPGPEEAPAGDSISALLEEQASLAEAIERLGGWDMAHRSDAMLQALGVRDIDSPALSRSGGEQRRIALARLLISEPSIAILDEPTNHLDIPAKETLEAALRQYDGTILMVSHDRYFISQVATKIVEIREGELRLYRGDYHYYLEKLEAEKEEARRQATEAEQAAKQVAKRRKQKEKQQEKAAARKAAKA